MTQGWKSPNWAPLFHLLTSCRKWDVMMLIQVSSDSRCSILILLTSGSRRWGRAMDPPTAQYQQRKQGTYRCVFEHVLYSLFTSCIIVFQYLYAKESIRSDGNSTIQLYGSTEVLTSSILFWKNWHIDTLIQSERILRTHTRYWVHALFILPCAIRIHVRLPQAIDWLSQCRINIIAWIFYLPCCFTSKELLKGPLVNAIELKTKRIGMSASEFLTIIVNDPRSLCDIRDECV